MHEAIGEFLGCLGVGKAREHSNMAVAPLFVPESGCPDYITLEEAIGDGKLAVGEVGPVGSVSELKVVNDADENVLMLDGEELHGAKQNRVLNTTILVGAHTEVLIPVSCTEHGRWRFTSPRFSGSDVVMSPSLRASKARAVSASLRRGKTFRGNQAEVWDNVAQQALRAHAQSPTGAMRDTYESMRSDLEGYRKAFPAEERQQGLLVFVNGAPVAFDAVSRAEAYRQLHAKLVNSYAMDAWLARHQAGGDMPNGSARDFIEEAAQCNDEPHGSVGLGTDHRCEGERMVGSALVHEGTVVHAAFFRSEHGERGGGLAASHQRRQFRI